MTDITISDTLHRLCGPIDSVDSEPLLLQEDFLDLASRFAAQPGSVLLYSGGELDCARHHLLGVWPWLTLCGYLDRVILEAGWQRVTIAADPFQVLEQTLAFFRIPDQEHAGPMAAGLLGYLAYDLKDCLEQLPRTSVDELGLPLMQLYAPSILVIQDKKTGAARLLTPRFKDRSDAAKMLRERFRSELTAAQAAAPAYNIDDRLLASNFERDDYHKAVQRIIDYIAAGDVYQVNMSQRFQAPFQGDAFALFRRLAALNPAPFFAFIQAQDHCIVSTSPERFLLQAGRTVEARPIKGTRPRCADPAQDAAMRTELENSPKDDAELSMIVDLLRNDLGKVCRSGSVRVREHKRLEAYENVYHLVSIVAGELDADKRTTDLLRAAFPGGSITGCPKVRAMEIIDELETCRRHVYCGSIGYIGFDEHMDLSIAIRTATLTRDHIRYSAGGGIVFDSRPAEEYEETLHKARTLLTACRTEGVQLAAEAQVWFNGRLMTARSACVGIADLGLLYGFGFFETIRVDQGRAPLIAAHLARYDKTWRALMPDAPPDISWTAVIDQVIRANGLEKRCAAVKLLATRGSRNQAPWDHSLLVTARPYLHRLTGKSAAGLHLGIYRESRQSPLAEYKTLNYLYYHQAGRWAAAHGYNEALILNPDGSVSETHTANLLLINERTVIRPVSAAVLPGVMAGAVCLELSNQGYRISAETVSCDQLMSAGQVLAANALMGCVPVLSLDGRNRPPCESDLWIRLNDAILPGWQDPLCAESEN